MPERCLDAAVTRSGDEARLGEVVRAAVGERLAHQAQDLAAHPFGFAAAVCGVLPRLDAAQAGRRATRAQVSQEAQDE